MRTLLLVGSGLVMAALLTYALVLPHVPYCRCHYEWQNGTIVIVCC